jgi:hypothetical protein
MERGENGNSVTQLRVDAILSVNREFLVNTTEALTSLKIVKVQSQHDITARLTPPTFRSIQADSIKLLQHFSPNASAS